MTEHERADKIEALRRYEEARREHLSGALNLIFGLAAAAVGFCITYITNPDSRFSIPGSYYLLGATLAFGITVALSMLTIWTRLRDFRGTAEKLRRELRGADDKVLKRLEARNDRLGILTWFLFRAQLLSFGVGIVLLAVALWMFYSGDILSEKANRATGAEAVHLHAEFKQRTANESGDAI